MFYFYCNVKHKVLTFLGTISAKEVTHSKAVAHIPVKFRVLVENILHCNTHKAS